MMNELHPNLRFEVWVQYPIQGKLIFHKTYKSRTWARKAVLKINDSTVWGIAIVKTVRLS